MSDTKFEIGNVVQLRSGSQRMTVCAIDEDDQTADCVWFEQLPNGDYSSDLQSETFDLISLKAES